MAFQGDSIYWVEVEKIVPNPFQPRREFDQNKLQELADSIRMYGVLQPLTVTRREVQRDDGTFYSEYELIAGERRLRASKLASIAQVPVIIREGEQSEQEKLELAIIENLQREDLNAVDRAIAFKQLADQFGLSHAQVAQKVGRSREYVSNSIRLLGLPEHMLHSLKVGDMMEGHARTLLMLTDRPEEQEVVYKEILLKKLSVREVERIVRKIATDRVRKKNPDEFDVNLIALEKRFTETLGTRVQIQKTDFGGKLTIDYFSDDDLESLLRRIKDEAVEQTASAPSMAPLAAATPLQSVAPSPEPISAPAEPTPAPAPTQPTTHAPEVPAAVEPTPDMVARELLQQPPVHVAIEPPAAAPEPAPVPAQTPEVMPEPPNPTPPVVPTPEPVPEAPATEVSPAKAQEQQNHYVPPAAPQPEPFSPVSSPMTPSEPSATKPSEDDSDLYSIRNFGV